MTVKKKHEDLSREEHLTFKITKTNIAKTY